MAKLEQINSEFYVQGMHCAACQILIEQRLKKVKGVSKVQAKLSDGKVYIESSKPLQAAKLSVLVEKDGYHITKEKVTVKAINTEEMIKGGLIAGTIFTGFLLLQYLGIIDILNTNHVNLPFVFLIGVVASVSTCMAVVGGLVISLSSTFAKSNSRAPIIAFHLSRLIGFFLLGGVIGMIGSAFILTSTVSFILSIILFFVMLIMGLNLLEITSLTHRLQPRMPKVIGNKVLSLQNKNSKDKKSDKSSNKSKIPAIALPLLLGAVTFFLPCGFTQSMQVYSLTTGSFIKSALVMFTFALGTLPVLSLISFSSVKISNSLKSGLFFKTAGFLVIFFAVFNFVAALKVIGVLH